MYAWVLLLCNNFHRWPCQAIHTNHLEIECCTVILVLSANKTIRTLISIVIKMFVQVIKSGISNYQLLLQIIHFLSINVMQHIHVIRENIARVVATCQKNILLLWHVIQNRMHNFKVCDQHEIEYCKNITGLEIMTLMNQRTYL